jgi:serpin B
MDATLKVVPSSFSRKVSIMEIQELRWIVMLIIGLGLCSVQPAFASGGNTEKDAVVRGNNAFALDLYGQVKTESGNLFFCPYSILTALTMTYAGARHNTEQQMAQVLHLDLGQQRLHQAVQAWLNDLSPGSGSQQGYQLYLANALWGQKGYGFLNEFLELIRTSYGAGLTELDFLTSVEEARKTINAWVKEQTQGKIGDLIKPGKLTKSTLLVLTNAIYFKGKWALPFDEEKTHDAPFTLITGDKILVPMMSQKALVNYFEDDTVQILELPYEGAQLSMILFLPNDLAQFPALETVFSVKYIDQQVSKLRAQKVMVGIPRFKITSEFSLPATLKAMGMTDAFSSPPADFSGMAGKQDLYISEVLHKAFVDVNEEGTEAAAATEVTMSRGMVQLPSFQADHPFLFLIRDSRSQSILFLGRVMNPRVD